MALENFALLTTVKTWLDALVRLQVIKPDDPAPKIPVELIPRYSRNDLLGTQENPTVKSLQEQVGRAISTTSSLIEAYKTTDGETDLAFYEAERAALEEANMARSKLRFQRLIATDEKYKTIKDLKLFTINYFSKISDGLKERALKKLTKTREYSSGQFLLREVLLRAILKLYGKPLPGYRELNKIPTSPTEADELKERQEAVNRVATDLGFVNAVELNNVFWGNTLIRQEHTQKSFEVLGLSDTHKPSIQKITGENLFAATAEEYRAWAEHIATLNDNDPIETYINSQQAITPDLSIYAAYGSGSGVVKYSRPRHSVLAAQAEQLDQRPASITLDSLWQKIASKQRRLEFLNELTNNLRTIERSVKTKSHPHETLIRFFLMHIKECHNPAENRIWNKLEELNKDLVFNSLNDYLGCSKDDLRLRRQNPIHADIHRKAMQLSLASDYIQELAAKIDDIAAFAAQLSDKTKLLELFKKAV